ncbi:hypothetical protein [Natronorubrum halophilum]|uniref:hypothetical protein n=1 Tax=Natronorubrum halophilum TaxID=1702106 RepID=UPI000EF640D7|nr:hypothetical protein [Natronorubrum halophilum]
MVTTFNITVDDDVADRVRDVKEDHGLTWPEFIEAASDALGGTHESHEPQSREPETVIDKREPEPSQDIDLENVTIDVPGSGDLAKRRKETIIKMAELLREQGTAEKSDFLEVVDLEEVRYKSKDSFWSNVVKGRDSLKAMPGVEKPPDGRTEWEWAGEEVS